jgi:putative nucleotidyltransferase with HDIG domain
MLLSTALFSVLVGISSSVNSNRTAIQQADRIMLSEAEKRAFELDRILTSVEIKAGDLASLVSLTYDVNRKNDPDYLATFSIKLAPYIKQLCENSEFVNGAYMTFGPTGAIEPFEVYYADQTGNREFLRQPSIPASDYLRTGDPDMDWYFDPIETGKGVWIRPYTDPTLKVKMISYVIPVSVNGHIVGVSGIDIRLSQLQKIVNDIKVYDTSSSYLLDSDLEFVVHEQYTEKDRFDQVENGLYRNVNQRMGNQSSGVIHMPIGYVNKAISFARLSGGHILIIEVPDYEIYQSVEKMTRLNFLIIVFGILLAVLFAFFIGKRLGKQIRDMARNMMRIAEGDFTTPIGDSYQNRRDEIGLLAKAVITMQASIRTMLEERNKHIEELRDKGLEISQKNLEITALYNQTSAMNSELQAILQKVEDGYLDTVKALSNAIEANDSYTKGHTEKVAEYSLLIGHQMGFDPESIIQLEYAALLHDIGKIGISDQIINKPGKLTPDEYAIIKQHPEIGYQILRDIEFLAASVPVIYQHHERPDGKGYPKGLTDESICLQAKIIAVADAFDAMVRARPYRLNPLSVEEAFQVLKESSGTQFDSLVVEQFIRAIECER